MLSKCISSISLFIMGDMRENPMAGYVKFGFHATLLINFGRASVIVLVARNLAVLQIMHFFRSSVISVKRYISKEI